MKIVSRDGSGGELQCTCTAVASDGQTTLPVVGPGFNGPILPLGPSETATVSVTQIPAQRNVQTFSAPGLSMGTHEWSYSYVFTGLKIGTNFAR
ncbi:MAG: hypothetical protein M3Z09_16335 [Acidobacteriota bacterium]|nr:hypothetical protein [Acidobacteriota bacterium]